MYLSTLVMLRAGCTLLWPFQEAQRLWMVKNIFSCQSYFQEEHSWHYHHGTGVQKLHCRRPWVIDLLDFCDLSKAPKISAALRRQSTLSVQACPTFMAEVYSIEDQFTNRGSPSSVYFSKLYCSVKMSSCPKPPLQIPLNLVARGLWMLLRKPLQYCTLCTVLDEVLIRVMKCKHSMCTRSFAKKELDCLLIP